MVDDFANWTKLSIFRKWDVTVFNRRKSLGMIIKIQLTLTVTSLISRPHPAFGLLQYIHKVRATFI